MNLLLPLISFVRALLAVSELGKWTGREGLKRMFGVQIANRWYLVSRYRQVAEFFSKYL